MVDRISRGKKRNFPGINRVILKGGGGKIEKREERKNKKEKKKIIITPLFHRVFTKRSLKYGSSASRQGREGFFWKRV